MHNAVPVDVLRAAPRTTWQTRGLYELLRAAGHVPRMATQVIGARSRRPRPRPGMLDESAAPRCSR